MASAQAYTLFAGSYQEWPQSNSGGIAVFSVSRDGSTISFESRVSRPAEAGFLAYAQDSRTLYAVDERKTDGRGPVGAAASVYAFAFNSEDKSLTELNSLLVPGPFPTYLALDPAGGSLACANHGSFDHIEKVVRTEAGWSVRYDYDDSTVSVIKLTDDGRLEKLADLAVLVGHGNDPNKSPQAGGHGQASPHAHCAVYSPDGKYLLVCDKATDQILTYELGEGLVQTATFHAGAETGPRHLVFNSSGTRAYVTYEFSSELAVLEFYPETGQLVFLGAVSTVSSGFSGLNEPADLRLHPNDGLVYVNNRGEDSLAWFDITSPRMPARMGAAPLSKSIHPGLAARSFVLSPAGDFLLLADRPGSLIRSFAIRSDGSLTEQASVPAANVVYLELAGLE